MFRWILEVKKMCKKKINDETLIHMERNKVYSRKMLGVENNRMAADLHVFDGDKISSL